MEGASAKRAVLALAVCVGCSGSLTTPDTTTQAQALAIERSHYYAQLKGVRLDAVVFAQGHVLPGGRPAAAWCVCGEYAIGWNVKWIEEPDASSHVDFVAAHEVCHIYYRDNFGCRKGYHYDEERADNCARAMGVAGHGGRLPIL